MCTAPQSEYSVAQPMFCTNIVIPFSFLATINILTVNQQKYVFHIPTHTIVVIPIDFIYLVKA